MRAFVGTSGWQYADWRGRFYPQELATARWLEHYARTFPTVEVNATFYRLPRRETVQRWASTVPRTFVFTLKASRYLTHVRRLRDGREPIERMQAAFTGAGSHLGPVLFQLPPTLEADAELLGSFLAAMPLGIRAAFEFRHASWLAGPVMDLLQERGMALVHGDRPGRRVQVPVVGGWSYLRFHQGQPNSLGYRGSRLADYADALVDARPREVFAYFNNDRGCAAPNDARTFMELLADRGVRLAA